jgi:hypothetical protein
MLRRILRLQYPIPSLIRNGGDRTAFMSDPKRALTSSLHRPTEHSKQKASPPIMPLQSSEDGHVQDQVLRHSLENPEQFWGEHAEHLHWHKKPSIILSRGHKSLGSGVSHETWEWFPDGEISTCYNCVDRHVLAGRGDNVAIYYDSPVTKTKERYTYNQLLEDVEVLAGALREEGVKKGDVVMLYSKLRILPKL